MKARTLLWPLLVFVVILTLGASELWKVSEPAYSILSSDGRGYYAYLPSFVVYGEGDYAASYAAETERLEHWKHQSYLHTTDAGRVYNKYFPGVALLVLPFFMLAYLLAFFVYPVITGYEPLFLYAFHVATVAYVAMGFGFVRSMAVAFSNSRRLGLFVALLTVFGTNLFYHTAYTPSLSHGYSFFAISGLMYAAYRLRDKIRPGRILLLIAFAALVFVIRPTNVLAFMLVPVMIGSKKGFVALLRALKSRWPAYGLITIAAFAPIPLLNLVQTGHLFNWSYAGEGFYFTQPELLNVLFSIRKGWFVWTPIAAVSMFGLLKLPRWRAVWATAFLATMVYVVASWWNWGYGSGFGHRAFIDIYGLVGVFLAALIAGITTPKMRTAFVALLLLLGAFNLFQSYQTLVGILPKDSITADMYLRSLTMAGQEYRGVFYGNNDIRPFGRLIGEKAYQIADDEVRIKASTEFAAGATMDLESDHADARHFFTVNLEIKLHDSCNVEALFLIMECRNESDSLVDYRPIKLYHYRDAALNTWHGLHYQIETNPESVRQARIYVWNKARCHCSVRQFRVVHEIIVP